MVTIRLKKKQAMKQDAKKVALYLVKMINLQKSNEFF
jgi:hypothetical protein